MKNLILLVTFALVFQFVKGAHHLPVATVTCKNNHTVDIAITNVDDYREWTASEWRLSGSNPACEPIIGVETVTYTNLRLPNCAMSSEQGSDSIKYVLKVSAQKTAGQLNSQEQTRAYDHLYYVSCDYDNQNRSSSSFVPIKNRDDNDSSNAFFTFSLQAFSFPNHTGVLPNTIELNTTMYFKVLVDTQSNTSNLDLHLVKCWGSSDSSSSSSSSSNVILIEDGCGNNTVSQDADDTLYYNCTNDDIKETFSLRAYRYLSSAENTPVFIHCNIRVCLADAVNSMCECPSAAACDPSSRKRRSLADNVDENVVYTVSSGPYILEADDEEEEGEEAEEEGESDEQDEPQSFSTNLAIILAVSCLVALAMVCGTVYLVARNRNRRRLQGDLNVAT